jgi:rSAM/selenodomain-associated transferase 2
MNRGIEAATGDALLFLHADTKLPEDALNAITQTITEGHFWGRFDVRLSGQQFMLRIIERMMNMRSCVTGIATGDQAIFISRECLDIVGQYSELPLMEDIDFSKRLREVDWPACLKNAVITSSRRWEDRGVWKTVLLMWRLRLLYFFGVPAEKLARQYQ